MKEVASTQSERYLRVHMKMRHNMSAPSGCPMMLLPRFQSLNAQSARLGVSVFLGVSVYVVRYSNRISEFICKRPSAIDSEDPDYHPRHPRTEAVIMKPYFGGGIREIRVCCTS